MILGSWALTSNCFTEMKLRAVLFPRSFFEGLGHTGVKGEIPAYQQVEGDTDEQFPFLICAEHLTERGRRSISQNKHECSGCDGAGEEHRGPANSPIAADPSPSDD